ncbi:hypothetical protein DV515_00015429, partial [Chloebia gouldiae]
MVQELGHLVSQSKVALVTQRQVPGWLITCHSPGWLWSASVTACARLKARPGVTAQGGLVTQCHTTCQAQGPLVSQHLLIWLLTWCHGAGCSVSPRCHQVPWRAPSVAAWAAVGVPGSRCGVALSPLSRHVPTVTDPRGTSGPGLLPAPRPGDRPGPGRAADRAAEDARSLPPPFLPGRYRGWARTGDG